MFINAAELVTGNKVFASSAFDGTKEIGLMWNKFRESYVKFFKHAPSELEVRQFQQYITESFRKSGIDAGMHVGVVSYDTQVYNGRFHEFRSIVNKDKNLKTLVVYNNSKVMDKFTQNTTVNNTSLEALDAQRFLDRLTFTTLGDDVSRVQYLQSKRSLTEYALNETHRYLAENYSETIEKLDLLEETEYVLRRGTFQDENNFIESMETVSPQRVQEDLGQNIKQAQATPCLPIPNKFYG
jgi:hypothetical protein